MVFIYKVTIIYAIIYRWKSFINVRRIGKPFKFVVSGNIVVIENIKCFHEINQQLAEVLLTVPEFWGKMKREVIDEKVAKLNKQAKKD